MSVLGLSKGQGFLLIRCDGRRIAPDTGELIQCWERLDLDADTGLIPEDWTEQTGHGGPRHWCPFCSEERTNPAPKLTFPRYRTGRTNGHTIYLQYEQEPTKQDVFVGSCTSPEQAERLVRMANNEEAS